jgi:hypothetical protein
LSVRLPNPETDAVHRNAHRALALAVLLLAACRIERTPQELIDPMNPTVVDQREGEREIAIRVAAFREALARGDVSQAIEALQPLPEAFVIGLDDATGRARFGDPGLADALGAITIGDRMIVRTPDLRVQSDLRERFAWFATHLTMFPLDAGTAAPARVRLSGVFRRVEGNWRLAHLHLSHAAPAVSQAAPPRAGPAGAPPADE